MLHIDPLALASHLTDRIFYLQQFLSFSSTDGAAIQASGTLLAPKIPQILDSIYAKLLSFDITASAFVPTTLNDPQGDMAPRAVQELSLSHPHVKRQMSFLRGYILRIVRNKDWSVNSPIWAYFDKVGLMHTGTLGKSNDIRVEYIHLGLLLAWLANIVNTSVLAMELEEQTKSDVIAAWNKLIWIQNDLFAKYYTEISRRDTSHQAWVKLVRDRKSVMNALLGAVVCVALVLVFMFRGSGA